MIILAIETSCDDTGVALLDINKSQINILADFVSSQVNIHAPFGGVVPNLAVRAHYKNLPILLEEVLKKNDPKKIDLVAVTIGPGLEPCLWAGVRTARALALAMKKPIVGVNHLEGHIAANWLSPVRGISNFQFPISKQISNTKNQSSKKVPNSQFLVPNSQFPVICLIVSGGHTQLVLIKDIGKYKILGQTRDDAAGEAFDKVAKLLGLSYPGGPEIALKAQKGRPEAVKLPRPMIDSQDYDFSFSGLKTAVFYLVKGTQKNLTKVPIPNSPARHRLGEVKAGGQFPIPDICASFQQAAVDVLVSKTIKAALKYKVKTVMLSGGVAANQELRKQIAQAVKAQIPNSQFLAPSSHLCTDNAVMIGLAGYWKYQRAGADNIKNIVAKANLNL